MKLARHHHRESQEWGWDTNYIGLNFYTILLLSFLNSLIDPSTWVAALSQDHCTLAVTTARPLVKVKSGES